MRTKRSKRPKRLTRRSRVQKSRVTRKRARSRRYKSKERRNTKRYLRGVSGHTLHTIHEESRVPEDTQKLKKELTEALRSAYILEDVSGRRLTLFQIRDYVETIIDHGNTDQKKKLENVLVILDKLALKLASNSFKNATTSKKRKKKQKKKKKKKKKNKE